MILDQQDFLDQWTDTWLENLDQVTSDMSHDAASVVAASMIRAGTVYMLKLGWTPDVIRSGLENVSNSLDDTYALMRKTYQ